MTDDLRTRIIAALLSEDGVALMADAVIRELRQEYRIDIGYGGYEFEQDRAAAVERLQEIHEDWGDDPPETGTVLQHRYVTEWENDDE